MQNLNLVTLSITSGLGKLGVNAFNNATSFKSINIPAVLKYLGKNISSDFW